MDGVIIIFMAWEGSLKTTGAMCACILLLVYWSMQCEMWVRTPIPDMTTVWVCASYFITLLLVLLSILLLESVVREQLSKPQISNLDLPCPFDLATRVASSDFAPLTSPVPRFCCSEFGWAPETRCCCSISLLASWRRHCDRETSYTRMRKHGVWATIASGRLDLCLPLQVQVVCLWAETVAAAAAVAFRA